MPELWWTTAAKFRVCFVRLGECSCVCPSIHSNLSLAFAFTLGIHLKATTRLISNLHKKNVSLPEAIVLNHHKSMVSAPGSSLFPVCSRMFVVVRVVCCSSLVMEVADEPCGPPIVALRWMPRMNAKGECKELNAKGECKEYFTQRTKPQIIINLNNKNRR